MRARCVLAQPRGVSRISVRGVLKARPHTRSGGGGGQFASGPIRKVGGGGDTFVWHKENTLSLIVNYNLTKGVLKHFTRARD